jgi:hypothetical protein
MRSRAWTEVAYPHPGDTASPEPSPDDSPTVMRAPEKAVDLRPAFGECVGKNVRVRKQYNFRPSANGLDAWDVDNLIAASSTLPVEEVPLDSIADVDTDFWFKFGPTPTVRRIIDHVRLMQEVDLSYPIIRGADGRVMDGMHRIARSILDGRLTIKAVQFVNEPEPDYRDCSPEDLPYGP